LGQKKSGFNIREVMDGQKILLVNLSKGLMGEQAAKLLGMVFVMKFQAAAMSRADTPESERKDFCLYVDEFQNFATSSFESILSEARKYRLNLILANQFMTQLTDTIKSAIIGNVPTKIVGRIGIDDAESLQRAFTPTFTAEDLTKLPNYNAVATVLIGGIPSAPFTMSLIPPIGKSNPELRKALKRYSASKFGRPKALVDSEIRQRFIASEDRQRQSLELKTSNNTQQQSTLDSRQLGSENQNKNSSFLDDWVKKREELRDESDRKSSNNSYETPLNVPKTSNNPVADSTTTAESNIFNNNVIVNNNLSRPASAPSASTNHTNNIKVEAPKIVLPKPNNDRFNVQHDDSDKDEVVFRIR